ncbi:D-beta-hydroxybutyrate dehydrogenase, mitochondrial isoform X1 [Anopheles aquasalis]|uniref:D-beta-hydroxybutyrate dehydrogenase, mitochondrial isoform X1 n=2 Tax=Anopheles aquasalis TaxID=42839 RepID=UPI00215B4265|nr:D-beta-hydroxybutyrate dehydrogenase, mitochondrial isoform X1 [Anopheles aquasalis]XP_050081755.1 D-beta-hydroxybutyrate dehydrogenase, mitochondrial isoform X1 [Anopheles aquasalis]
MVPIASSIGKAMFLTGVGLVATGLVGRYYFIRRRQQRTSLPTLGDRDVVIITGCDSGLGFNMAIMCLEANAAVIGTFVSTSSDGYAKLCNSAHKKMIPVILDLCDESSINAAIKTIRAILSDATIRLYALVNNSAVMCFGEAEWLPATLITEQLRVNLAGPLLFTGGLIDLLRRDRARLVIVTSHCSQQALPGLSVYSATKAALHGWATAIRFELEPHGVPVVEIMPGSFLLHSNICARQATFFDAMWAGMAEEQRCCYGRYFQRYRDYLDPICQPRPAQRFPEDNTLSAVINGALFDPVPKRMYKCEPWRYWLYYTAFAWTPYSVRSWLIRRFLAMPTYHED